MVRFESLYRLYLCIGTLLFLVTLKRELMTKLQNMYKKGDRVRCKLNMSHIHDVWFTGTIAGRDSTCAYIERDDTPGSKWIVYITEDTKKYIMLLDQEWDTEENLD